ncbi:hypothetical protein [Ferrimonas kyonanensis]|uniref:hypothetical protein n=1 Tax=Ferrimonas kyonanensis TaxID=364763 RepID=UPI0012EC5171|nr:hypothetical protein [Ferrimonas kyonanensis]
MTKKHYEQLYSWRNFINDSVLVHQDGAVSIAVVWDGINSDLSSFGEIKSNYDSLRGVLNSLPIVVTCENHLVRDMDYTRAEHYLEYGAKNAVRLPEIDSWVRQEMAEHLVEQSLSNRVVTVLTMNPKSKGFLSLISAKAELKLNEKTAKELMEVADSVAMSLKGGRVLSKDGWAEYVGRMMYPDYQNWPAPLSVRGDYFLHDQWVRAKPKLVSGCTKVGDYFFKTGLMFFSPDTGLNATPGFNRLLSQLDCYTHLTQVVRRLNKDDVVKSSANKSKHSRGFSSESGAESAANLQQQESQFRDLVDNNSEVYDNAFFVTIATNDPKETNRISQKLVSFISNHGGELRTEESVQMAFWRYRQMGQGRFIQWMRDDVDHQVAHMWPALVFSQGDKECPQQLRRTHTGELITKGFRRDAVNHSITVAMTGAGKGVNKCAEIFETYCQGIDWYIAEVGKSYEWTVEALGGSYIDVDPEETVINPMPDISLANENGQLPPQIKVGTVSALSFILLDDEREYSVHERTAAEMALGLAYEDLHYQGVNRQPVLRDFLNALSKKEFFEGSIPRQNAAQRMAENLDSFLYGEMGRIFNREGNLQLHKGIIAVNLKPVQQKSPQLLKFFFVFVGLAFAQYAFSAGSQARVLLDEMHVLAKEAPAVSRNLISGVARMGRKDGASIDLVTQETEEIDSVEAAVINQTPYFNYLYRQADWDHIAERMLMPDPVLEHWKSWGNPVAANLPYRPALMLIQGVYFSLELTFPKSLLSLASSSETDLAAKEVIGSMTNDIDTRLMMLNEYRKVFNESRDHSVCKAAMVKFMEVVR